MNRKRLKKAYGGYWAVWAVETSRWITRRVNCRVPSVFYVSLGLAATRRAIELAGAQIASPNLASSPIMKLPTP